MRVMLTALNGLLRSKVIDVPVSMSHEIYYCFHNKHVAFLNEPFPSLVDFRKLRFEPTGQVIGKGKKRAYEFELTEI